MHRPLANLLHDLGGEALVLPPDEKGVVVTRVPSATKDELDQLRPELLRREECYYPGPISWVDLRACAGPTAKAGDPHCGE